MPSETAHFVLCVDCRRHGRIVLRGGLTLPETDTKEQAWTLLGFSCQERGGLLSEDVRAIGEDIEASELPEGIVPLPKIFRSATRLMVVFWNMNLAGGGLQEGVTDPTYFHKLFLSEN